MADDPGQTHYYGDRCDPPHVEPLICWDQTVDSGRFRCYVKQHPSNGHLGTLRVEVVETGELLLEEEVGVAFAAIWGPDVDDVMTWQSEAIAVIDLWIERHG